MDGLPPSGWPMLYVLRVIAASLLTQYHASNHLLGGKDPGTLTTATILWKEIVFRAERQELRVTGYRAGSSAREDLDVGLLRQARMHLERDAVETTIGTFTDVSILPVLGLVDATPRTRGGRPPEMELEFIQEVVRRANTPDGFGTVREIKAHMVEWCSERHGDQAPSTRSIERWLKRILPPELATK